MTVPKCKKCDKDWSRHIHNEYYCEDHANEVQKTEQRKNLRSGKISRIKKNVAYYLGIITAVIGIIYFLTDGKFNFG